MASVTEQAARSKEAVLAVELLDRAAIVVRGGERVTWLNGLVTCDLAKLEPGAATYGLLVEKKGKIQTDFFVVPSADALVLAVPSHLRDDIIGTLDHYLIMEDAELEAVDLVFFQLLGPKAEEARASLAAPYAGTFDVLGIGGAIVAAPRNDAFAEKVHAECTRLGGLVGDEAGWNALRVERGIPRFGVEFDTTYYPQEAALEKRAVSFDKGCYLGQEVVYMLENRGHVKKKLVPLDVEGNVPAAGDKVTTPEGAEVGDVKSAIVGPLTGSPKAIAMVKWAQSKPGTELRIGDRVARVRASDRA